MKVDGAAGGVKTIDTQMSMVGVPCRGSHCDALRVGVASRNVTVRIVLGSSPGPRVWFGLSPLAELTAVLHALENPAHHAAHKANLQEIRQRLPAGLQKGLNFLSSFWGNYRCRLLFPSSAGLNNTLEEELAAIENLSIDTFSLLAGWAVSGGYTGRHLESLQSCDAAKAELRQRAAGRGRRASALAGLLLDDPAELRASLLAVLRQANQCFFAEEWARNVTPLSLDVAHREQRILADGLTVTLEELFPTTARLEDPERLEVDMFHEGTISLDRQPILVTPTVYGSPHMLIKHEGPWPAVMQYPYRVRPTMRAFRVSEIQRRLAVLSDRNYLRLVRMVAGEPLPTIELARRLNVDPTQVSRQLRVLRDLSLVESSRQGRYVYYRVSLAEVARLGTDILEVIFR